MDMSKAMQGFQDQLAQVQKQMQAGFEALAQPASPPPIPQHKLDELLSDQQKKLIAIYQEYMAANPEEARMMDSVLLKFGAHVRERMGEPDPVDVAASGASIPNPAKQNAERMNDRKNSR